MEISSVIGRVGLPAPIAELAHPAGSVIALNGRNAAMAVLEDAGVPAPVAG